MILKTIKRQIHKIIPKFVIKGLSSFCIIMSGLVLILNSQPPIIVRAAPILDIASTLVSSGTAPFDSDDTAGNDSNNTNNIVRTNDSFIIKYDYSVNGENATNAYIDINMLGGIRSMPQFQLPPACISGSFVNNPFPYSLTANLRCVLGNITAGTTSSFFITFYNYSFDLPTPNGAIFSVVPNFFATGSSVVGLPVQIVSSSQPRYNASIPFTPTPTVTPGPNGESGYLITTDIRRRNGQNLGAFGDKFMDIQTDNYSFNINYAGGGGPYTGAVLYTWGSGAPCTGGNGNIVCTQPGGAGSTVNLSGGGFISNVVRMWVPATDVVNAPSQNLNLSLVISNFDPDGVDGSSNFGSGIEPLNDNTRVLNLQVSIGSTFSKINFGLPFTNIGNSLNWQLRVENTGNTFPLTASIVCDKIDTSTQIFLSAYFGYTATQPQYDLEYSTSPNTPNISSATCEDSDGPWTLMTGNTVPLNIAESVTKVRVKNIVGGIPASTTGTLGISTLLKFDVINGSTVYNYGSFKPELNDTYRSTVANTLATTNVAGIDLSTIGANKQAGDIVNYTIRANTSTYVNNQNSTTTITSTLPNTLTYEPGSASLVPDSVVVNPDQTTTITWSYTPVFNTPSNSCQSVPYLCNPQYGENTFITFQAKIKTSTPSNTTIINRATLSNTLDATASITGYLKQAQVSTLVTNPSTFFIENTANQNYTQPDQAFSYNIRYGNLTTNTIDNIDLIDVLPYNGDGLTPATNFTGSLRFDSLTVNNGETVLYTKNTFASLSNDPCNPSNIGNGLTSPTCNNSIIGTGSTIWCPSFSGGACPANASEVTAFRVQAAGLTPNTTRSLSVQFQPTGNINGNRYTNRISGRASGLALIVFSNAASSSVSLGSISGNIWRDTNSDGIKNTGETNFANVPVTLSLNTGSGSQILGTINTDANGNYIFNDLAVGDYTITALQPNYTTRTFDKDGIVSANRISSQFLTFNSTLGATTINNTNFGYRVIPASFINVLENDPINPNNSIPANENNPQNSVYVITSKLYNPELLSNKNSNPVASDSNYSTASAYPYQCGKNIYGYAQYNGLYTDLTAKIEIVDNNGNIKYTFDNIVVSSEGKYSQTINYDQIQEGNYALRYTVINNTDKSDSGEYRNITISNKCDIMQAILPDDDFSLVRTGGIDIKYIIATVAFIYIILLIYDKSIKHRKLLDFKGKHIGKWFGW